MLKPVLFFLSIFLVCSCAEQQEPEVAVNPETYWGENPWPDIRKKRISLLLPQALKTAEVDCWMTM